MKLDKRRRIEHRTNYKKRLLLLKSKIPRLVVRKTNKFLIIQIVESKESQDRIIFSVNTKELLKKGWPKEREGSLKSISAGYLGGILIGKKARGMNTGIILDIGLNPSTKNSRIYAVAKGAIDSGLDISCDKKMFPEKEKIGAKNTKLDEKTFKKIAEEIMR